MTYERDSQKRYKKVFRIDLGLYVSSLIPRVEYPLQNAAKDKKALATRICTHLRGLETASNGVFMKKPIEDTSPQAALRTSKDETSIDDSPSSSPTSSGNSSQEEDYAALTIKELLERRLSRKTTNAKPGTSVTRQSS